MHYYNEFDPFAADWLENLIFAGEIPQGVVDRRSITEVMPGDLVGFTQCHFFAGIGGWPLALRMAGWPEDREIWTGSPPCQPFSDIGLRKGQDDERHLWPEYFRLIRARWPAVVMGEQVADAIAKHWLDGVLADLEREGYACRPVVLPACAVDAPHRRYRIYFVGDGYGLVGNGERAGLQGHAGHVAHAGEGAHAFGSASAPGVRKSAWAGAAWTVGHDGKRRRFEPGIRPLVDGLSPRVGGLHAYGNAIVPQLAAEVIGAYMDVT